MRQISNNVLYFSNPRPKSDPSVLVDRLERLITGLIKIDRCNVIYAWKVIYESITSKAFLIFSVIPFIYPNYIKWRGEINLKVSPLSTKSKGVFTI